jgi:uncharacterized protein (DUF952 family)
VIYHITTKASWQEAVRRGLYEPESLKTEGFVHCSTLEQTLGTATRYFLGQADLVLLCIDPSHLTAQWRFEAPANPLDDRAHELFPHIYGPVNLDAVLRAVGFPRDATGNFQLPRAAVVPAATDSSI